MKTVGLFEAKQRLSELVEEAANGRPVGITNHGALKAILATPPRRPQRSLAEVLAALRGSIRLPPGESPKDLIRAGRRL